MTTADERRRSLYLARTFLTDLLDPKKTPGVPRAIRKEAAARLKHYPMPCDLDEMLRARAPARMHPFTCTTSGGSYMNFLEELLVEDLTRINEKRKKVSRRDTVKKSAREPGCWL